MLPKSAFYHAFNQLPGVGPQTIKAWLKHSGLPIDALWAQVPSLPPLYKGTTPSEVSAAWRQCQVEKEWTMVEKAGIRAICLDDADYPEVLKNIYAPPTLLYYRGVWPKPKQNLITVVGTRRMTPYGQMAIDQVVAPACRAGLGLVSGLAFGVDAAAHRAALDAEAYTLAVLGSSVDMVTPTGNQWLGRRILEKGGCLVSEFPPGTNSIPGNFPRRNRILAGLAPLTLVIEADLESGSLSTATHAREENRELATIPGPINSQFSRGCNALLKAGAIPIVCPDDIFAALKLPVAPIATTARPRLTSEESALLAHLALQPTTLDALVATVKVGPSALLPLLMSLEIKGYARHVRGQGYVQTGTAKP